MIADIFCLLLLSGLSVYCALTSWPYWISAVFFTICLFMAIYLLLKVGIDLLSDLDTMLYLLVRFLIAGSCGILAVVFLICAIITWANPAKFSDGEMNQAFGAVGSMIGWVYFIGFIIYLGISAWFLVSQKGYMWTVELKVKRYYTK